MHKFLAIFVTTIKRNASTIKTERYEKVTLNKNKNLISSNPADCPQGYFFCAWHKLACCVQLWACALASRAMWAAKAGIAQTMEFVIHFECQRGCVPDGARLIVAAHNCHTTDECCCQLGGF